jgi:hypothetical protein
MAPCLKQESSDKEHLLTSGYEEIYESLVPRLAERDYSEVAARLGLTLKPDGALSVNFLGREYKISSSGVNPVDGKPVNINNRSVVAYYALSRGLGEPALSYVPLSYFAGTVRSFSTNLNWMNDPLGKTFNGDYERFSETMCRLGGISDGKRDSGGCSWFLEVLPKIPVRITYYDADDEFPCEVQIMFDKNASRFLDFECLAFLEGCLVRAMIMTARTGDTSGWV